MNSDNAAKQLSIINPRPNEVEQSQNITQAVSRIADSFGSLEEYRPVDRGLKETQNTDHLGMGFAGFLSVIMGIFLSVPSFAGVLNALFLPEVAMIGGMTLSNCLAGSGIGISMSLVGIGILYLADEIDKCDNYHPCKKSLRARLVRFLSSKKRKAKILEYLKKEEISNTEIVLFAELVKAKKEEFAKEITAINSIFNDREIFIDNNGLVTIREFDKAEIAQPELTVKELIVKDIVDSIQRYGTVDLRELSQ